MSGVAQRRQSARASPSAKTVGVSLATDRLLPRGSIIALRSFVATIRARPSNPPTLLIVDDDPEVRMLLCELFAQKGFRVHVAEDGEVAIRFLEQNEPPTVILLDLVMPRITGTGVLSYLGSKPSLLNIPVAIVSGTPDLAPPGCRVFRKPLRFASLLEFVRTACDGRPLVDAA
jgi:CheY-like chemotaxis protein